MIASNDTPSTPEMIKATTLEDSIARRVFYDMMVREMGMTGDRELSSAWAAPHFDGHKQVAYRLARDVLDISEAWCARAVDGKLTTARALKMPTK